MWEAMEDKANKTKMAEAEREGTEERKNSKIKKEII